MHLPTWPRFPTPRALLGGLAALVALGVCAIGTEAIVRARLDETLGRATTRYYARLRVLQPGMRLSSVQLQRYLERMHYRRVSRRAVGAGEYRSNGSLWTIGRRAFRVADQVDPGGTIAVFLDDGWVSALEDPRGGWVSRVLLEPEQLRPPGPPADDRIPVPLAEVPEDLVNAVLAVEDQHFFHHSGVDLKRIVGAALADVRAGEIVQGASTITQQLAKNLFLSARRSPVRKLRELAMAVALEARYSKQQILETYLNEVYLGQDGAFAIRGVGRAAQFYFGKDVSQLNLAESALLAGLIRGPNLYAPFSRPALAHGRRDLVLSLMRDQGLIDQRQARRAFALGLGVRRTAPPTRAGRYFADFVAEELRDAPELAPQTPGLTVFTTLDMDLQLAAEEAVRAGIAQLEREHRELQRAQGPLQAALVVLEPRTGEVLAMVGGRHYGTSQFNRAAHGRRQPGSAFKPIVALTALSERVATLATPLEDQPLSVETPSGLWQPVNYDGGYRGSVTLRAALEHSFNVPFARLGLEVGPDRIAATGRKLGIESPLHAVPSLALGSSEVTPLELARAFGVFAASGFRATSHALLGSIAADGVMHRRQPEPGAQVFSPSETYLVTSALEGAVDRGTGRGLRARGYWGPIAAKSGTTNDFRDAWFVGYTSTLAVAVWVGFDDGASIGLSGAQAALPIFARLLLATPGAREADDIQPPPDLEIAAIDPETGLAANEACGGEPEYFLPGTVPPPSADDDCWSHPSLPSWVADANARVSAGIRALLERLLLRTKRRR